MTISSNAASHMQIGLELGISALQKYANLKAYTHAVRSCFRK